MEEGAAIVSGDMVPTTIPTTIPIAPTVSLDDIRKAGIADATSAILEAHQDIEYLVHDLHNLLDDNDSDGIVDYRSLEATLKVTINKLAKELTA